MKLIEGKMKLNSVRENEYHCKKNLDVMKFPIISSK